MLAFVLSELAVFGGALYLMPRGSLGSRVLVDAVRAIAAALLTAGLFRLIFGISPWLGVPLWVITFSVFSLVVGLVKRDDVEMQAPGKLGRR